MGLEGWPRAAVGLAMMEVRLASGERGDGGANERAALGVWCVGKTAGGDLAQHFKKKGEVVAVGVEGGK